MLVGGQAFSQSVPVNAAVIINSRESLLGAPEVVRRIAAIGDKRVMFVVTVHCRLTPEWKPIEYGLFGGSGKPSQASDEFVVMDEESLAFLQEHLIAAFAAATNLGMDIAVLPHLDAAEEPWEWRNHFDFDPQQEVAGYSYETALIDPCLAAIQATARKQTRIDFSLSGEMGRSLFAHPRSYRTLRERVQARLSQYPLTIGVSLNHNELAGGHKPTPGQVKQLQGLLQECDYVGFSNYGPFEPPPSVDKFTTDCTRFLAELESHGLRVPPKTPLHFSEIGLGGAPNEDGEATVERAASSPWEGTKDAGNNPWTTAEMIALRRSYHEALLTFLQTQPGPRRVDAAYFWSEGSWEPLGVDQSAFADEVITRSIREHNTQAKDSTPPSVPRSSLEKNTHE